MSPLLLSILTTAILVIVAVWELISLKSGAAGGRPETPFRGHWRVTSGLTGRTGDQKPAGPEALENRLVLALDLA